MFNSGKYRVYFKHKVEEWGYTTNVVRGRDVDTPYRGYTQCFILDKETGIVVAWGTAYCSVVDRFDRAVGRRVAFGRAVSNLDKDVRTILWEEFLKLSK